MMRKNIILSIKFLIIVTFLFSNINSVYSQSKVITNSDKGIWDRDHSKQIILVHHFTLGIEGGIKNQVLYEPKAVVVNNVGEVFVLDSGNNRVQKYDKEGHFLNTIAGKGKGPGELLNPRDMTTNKIGNIYIADSGNKRVQIFSNIGKFSDGFNVASSPSRIEVDTENCVYVVMGSLMGMGRNLLFKHDESGHLITSFVKTIKDRDKFVMTAKNQVSTSTDINNNIYIAYLFDYKISKYDKKGNLLLQFNRKLNYPILPPKKTKKGKSVGVRTPMTVHSIVCDNQDLVFVLLNGKLNEQTNETENQIIDVFNTDGQYLTKIELDKNSINEIYVDSERNLYLIDMLRQMQVHKYSLNIENK